MLLLGINAYHGDSSACIYRDGELLAASEEERFRRIKHWAGLPVQAIAFCLQEAGADLTEIDHITVSRNPYAKIGQKLRYVFKRRVSILALKDRVRNSFNIKSLKSDIAEAFGYQESDLKAEVQYIEHHRSHMASSFFASPFERAAILSIDGFGDFTSTMRGLGVGDQIEVIDSLSYPHSLGIFYTTLTQFLGFPQYGDEYKVMGLAPYGSPKMVEPLREVIRLRDNGLFALEDAYFRHFKEGVSMSWDGGSPSIEPMFTAALEKRLGPARRKGEPLTQYHKDLAASVQRITEEVIFHLAADLHRRTGEPNLCITGGVAQNSVANGKIVLQTPFEKLFVPPAGHDGGTSVGSALYFFHHQLKKPRSAYRPQAYTGARFSNEQIEAVLKEAGLSYRTLPDEELFEEVATRLAAGAVVGWFQGRAEFGPRALGNRSILVDPRRSDARDLLNEKIKRRESFRPFAPSILREQVGTYFEQIDEVPFMEKVFVIRPERREEVPAVTHVDGTGRLQTVDVLHSPRYHRLIEAFYRKTGVPILLNTSFNENEPIVNSPQEALDCYLRTKMDLLVLENQLVSRQD
ncbi:MAG: carbamoyltransferase [Saprospiraceae bacterium]|nr:carbamoyltransferase [Saprospiraceae bacterium]